MMTGNIEILYEDNHIICAVKPRGVLSQADSTGAADMLSLLSRYVADRYNKPGNVYLGLVQRLDRPVGGVMVFARTSKAAARLSEQIRERAVIKTYLAVVHGRLRVPDAVGGTEGADSPDSTDVSGRAVRPEDNKSVCLDGGAVRPESGTVRLEHRIRKDRNRNIVAVSDAFNDSLRLSDTDKDKAVLEYTVLETVKSACSRNSEYTLVKVNLITGRPHQIRAQFAYIGHPVVGDRKYGQLSAHSHDAEPRRLSGPRRFIESRHNEEPHRHAESRHNEEPRKFAETPDYDSWRDDRPVKSPSLWAYSLEFLHPVRGEAVRVSSPPPTDEHPWNIFF